MKVLLFVNVNKDKDLSLTNGIIKCLEKKSIEYSLFKADGENNTLPKDEFKGVELIIALGGDGTMLYAVREAAKTGIPVFGVNIGRMGFLTEVEYNDFENALNSLIKGNYSIEERMLLKAIFSDEAEEIAVNDVCVVNETPGKLIDIDVFVNDSLAESFRGDGIIVSSPTGSTGYSMSAGGPIVSPMARCLIVTPICAHSLTTKPLVLCDTDKVRIEVKNEKNGLAVFDGQSKTNTNGVLIEKSTYTGKFIRLRGYNFFDVMSHKFSNKGFK